ncbi:MAG: DUF1573 domain-containing protein [Candidatus Bipolaricaulia bacterium]
MKRFGIWAVLALLIVAGAGLYGYNQSDTPPRISIDPSTFDWGQVPNDQPVTQSFAVSNTGGQPLEIQGLSTSCGCTTAEVDQRRVPSGETTTLHVTFDPTTHADMTGDVMRAVYLRTNDPHQPEAVLELHAKVVSVKGGEAP